MKFNTLGASVTDEILLLLNSTGKPKGLVSMEGVMVPLGGAVAALAGRKTACAVGDSITDDAGHFNAPYITWSGTSWLGWARAYLNDRLDIPLDRVFAVSGHTTRHLIEHQLQQALGTNADLAFVHIGTNDLFQNVPVATIITNLKNIYDAFLKNGTAVVAIPVRLRNGASYTDWGGMQRLMQVNRWIAQYARTKQGIIVADPNPIMSDGQTGQALSKYFRDGLHDNAASAQVMGKVVADVLKPLFVPMEESTYCRFDTYHATHNPYGNLLPGGTFHDTGGGTSKSATGTVAAGWNGAGQDAGGASVVYSKESHPLYPGLSRQVITFGGTANTVPVEINAFNGSPLDTMNIGDKVIAEVEVEYNFTTGSIYGVSVENYFYDEFFGPIKIAVDGFVDGSQGTIQSSEGIIRLRTEPITVMDGLVFHNLTIITRPAPGAIAGTVKLSRASLRKVP